MSDKKAYPDGDPRNAPNAAEAARKVDGTFDGFRLISWLSESTMPGCGVSVDDVMQIVDDLGFDKHEMTRADMDSVIEESVKLAFARTKTTVRH